MSQPVNPQNPATGSYTVNAPKSARTGTFVSEHNRHPDARLELSQPTDTNQDHLDDWRDHSWWPAINYAHETIRKLFPEYQILQIKEKFGGLRYYWSIDNDDSQINHPNFSHAEQAIRYAEGWVDGYQHALLH